MKASYLLSVFCILLIFTGCKKDEEKTGFKVSGILKSDGELLVNATVDIDGLEQYKTKSNSEGYFLIENVPEGSHSLNTKKGSSDNGYIQKSYDIELQNDDLYFQSLILPNPVLIDTIILDSINNIAIVKWNKSIAEDFREYKLYSHSSSGLDETTGELEHVTIDVNDTVKSVQLENLSEKYFRVFVLNEYGQLGGSNIKNVTSANRNNLIGSDFEDPALFYSTWETGGNTFIIDSVSYNNSSSLYLFSDYDTINYYSTTYNFTHPGFLVEENEEYVVSFWYKVRGLGNMMSPFSFNCEQNNQNILSVNFGTIWEGEFIVGPIAYIAESEWTYYEKPFFSNSNSAVSLSFYGDVNELFIDDIQVKKKL